MKFHLALCGSLLFVTALAVQATPVLVTGTPGDSLMSPPTNPFPPAGTLVNFGSLTPFTTFSPSTFSAQGVTISSPDGLTVEPFSEQTFENFLFDSSADGSANISIGLANGAEAIGVGIADSDPVTITLEAVGKSGNDLGSFNVTLPTNGLLAGNGYFVVEDSTPDIFGLDITQPTGNANFSGLALATVAETPTPEPSSSLFLAAGLAAFGFFRLRKRA